jgi:diguanylate cyclase (GGDEF)-like protein
VESRLNTMPQQDPPRETEGVLGLLLLGFPESLSEEVRDFCARTAPRFRLFTRVGGSDVENPDQADYDVVALYLADSGLDDLAYLMRLSHRCATVVVTQQSPREMGWLRLVNAVVPLREFSPQRLVRAADEALQRRRHQYAGVVTADALHSLRQVVGEPGGSGEPGILIVDQHDQVIFANHSAQTLGNAVTRRVLDGLHRRTPADRVRAEQRLDNPELFPQPLNVSTMALEEHGHPLSILRIEPAAAGVPMEALLRRLSLLDVQTGLPNRAHFVSQLEHAIKACAGTSQRMALLMLRLQPEAGSSVEMTEARTLQIRRMAAERLREGLRTDDVVARLGGDTFGVLLRGFSRIDDLTRIAHKLAGHIAGIYPLGDAVMRISCRAGVSLFPDDGHSAMAQMHCADRALIRSLAGSGRVVEFFQPELGEKAQRRWALESRLPDVIGARRLGVHYQPLVDPSTRRIVGAEALARWDDPQLGSVSPMEFIPLVEELQLMNDLGEQVYESSFAQLREWHRRMGPEFRLSINVSPSQFLWPGFLRNLERQMQHAGVPASAVELEVTEGLLIEDHALTRLVLNEAATLGVHVFLDDFGTGYSSLGYLVDLPVSGIKVDRTFCKGLPDSRNHVAMTATILTLARYLSLDVLVEGVETEAQARFLASHGVPRLQGYLFSPPVDAAAFSNLLRS